jgi:hypothetical protein
MSIKKWIALAGILAGLVLLVVLVVQASPPQQRPGPQGGVTDQGTLGTGFTYQGQLESGGELISGDCEMAFRLYDAESGGNQVGSAITHTVPISDGLFTVNLDFGNGAFTGDARWLGIRVQCPGDTAYADLGRQALTATPYALYALSAGNADLLDGLDSSAFASKADVDALTTRVAALEGQLVDSDSDGYYVGCQDCNDQDPGINPQTNEICDDDADNDCDGLTDCADSDCTPDIDGDGHASPPCGSDCDDSKPDVYPGSDDLPDMSGSDEDCDGIDGERDNGIFVADYGDDGNDGSLDTPLLTIQAGIAAAVAQGKRDVYVAFGVYTEQITLAAGVGIYGGYSPDFQTRDPLSYTVAIHGPDPQAGKPGTVNCLNINGGTAGSTVFDGFSIYGHKETTPGASSYALYVRNCDETARITNNHIFAGRGGDGLAGTAGTAGNSGPSGSIGVNALDLNVAYGVTGHDCTPSHTSPGGSGGAGYCAGTVTSGGDGGNRVCPTFDGSETGSPVASENGYSGYNVGGPGGAAGRDVYQQPYNCTGYYIYGPLQGSDGFDGASGINGTSGTGCGDPGGSIVNGLWIENNASALSGSGGAHGGGGGGGGSGAGAYVHSSCLAEGFGTDNLGGTGGGGGAGGCAGVGGNRGESGGGAFAVFVVFDVAPISVPAIQSNWIYGGTGGDGGDGGRGGIGGAGGDGALGGTGVSYFDPAGPADPVYASYDGGKGGDGGSGGHGGGGGGGCGGPSYAIYVFGQGTADLNTWEAHNLLVLGVSGAGGRGGYSPDNPGSPGGDGQGGTAAATNF